MDKKTILTIQDLNLYYGENHVLHDVNMDVNKNEITALIGPSGCGKSTFLKTLNRMNDLVPNCQITGKINFDGTDIYDKKVDPMLIRKKSVWCFRKRIHFLSVSMIMWLMHLDIMAFIRKRSWISSLSQALRRQHFGMK